MAPIDEFQGTQYLGKGLGSRHLVNHGIVTDHALVAETTDFGITWVEVGVAYIKLTIKGEAIYTPRSYRSDKIENHPNAIVKMAHFIKHLEEWAEQYEKDNTCRFSEIEMVPKIAVGALRGGVPYKPYRTSGVCSIYIDVRIPPGRTLMWVKDQLRQLVRSLNMEAEIQTYLYRAGYEGKNVSRLIESVESSYLKICGKKTETVPTPVASMWRDINVFNEVGIPAITFGPPRCTPPEAEKAKGKFLYKRDLLNASKMYALVAMDICGLKRG
jgi:acetylornithine deacetylase/succinyl-diaminopimelate desuccinylase-like protein